MGVLGRIRPGFAGFGGRIQDQDLRTDRRDLAPWLWWTSYGACAHLDAHTFGLAVLDTAPQGF